jgi:hypothetical protein
MGGTVPVLSREVDFLVVDFGSRLTTKQADDKVSSPQIAPPASYMHTPVDLKA